MALVVGLDIGTRTVKGAVFTGSANKFQLADFFVEEVPEIHGGVDSAEDADEESELALGTVEAVVRRTLERRGLLGADVIGALDSKDCFIREVTVPFTKDDQIRRTVPFEAENHFLSFDLDEVVLEWMKTGEHDGKSRLILLALRNDVVEERLKLFSDASCDPVALDLDGAALFNAFTNCPYYAPEQSALLVDMGATSTKIVLVDHGKLKKVRSLRTGSAVLSPSRLIPEPAVVGAGVDGGDGEVGGTAPEEFSLEARFQEIEEALGRLGPIDEADPERPATPIAILADEEYDRLRGAVEDEVEREFDRRFDEPGEEDEERSEVESEDGNGAEVAGSPLQQAFPGETLRAESAEGGQNYQEYLERIAVEIQRTFATTALDTPLTLICLTGGMSRPEAVRYFGDEFDIETVQLEFGENFATVLPQERMREVATEGAVAVGLGLKGLGLDVVGIDFRKGPFRYEHRFERLKIPLLVCSLLCLAFFLQLAFWAYHEFEYQSNRANGFLAEQQQAFKSFFDKEVPAGTTPLGAAQKQKKIWEGHGAGDVGRFLSYTEAIHDFGKTTNATGLEYEIQTMTFNLRVRRVVQTGGSQQGPRLRAQSPSQVLLTSPDSRAHLKLADQFRTGSAVFNAETDARPQQGGYRVNMSLEIKPAALAKLE